MEAHEVTVAHLPLGEVVCAWGADTVSEVLPRLTGVVCHLVVLGGDGSRCRVFRSSQVLRADPGELLDLVPGGSEAEVIDVSTRAHFLPRARPLLIREGSEIIGILLEDAPPARVPEWRKPRGSTDARVLAARALRKPMESFRKQGVPVVLDLRPCRVSGQGELLEQAIETLMAAALKNARKNTSFSCVHVLLAEGKSGTWLVVEDRSGRLPAVAVDALIHSRESKHSSVKMVGALRTAIEPNGGSVAAQPGPDGLRIIVCLPGA